MVKFFAPWCGHCQAFKPKYEKFEELMRGEKQLSVAEVDCTKRGDICNQEGVPGYPTVRLYRDGDVLVNYQGNRDTDSLKEFVQKYLK